MLLLGFDMQLGMSDLLSPFVVLFEDDADAFWCFEMLIRRMVFLNFKGIYVYLQYVLSVTFTFQNM